MKTATATLESISTYGQSKHYEVPKKAKENAKDYEERTWRERCHYDKEGLLFIPPMQFKKCIENAGKYLNMQIPGKGKSTYSKHIKSGILVVDGITLPVKKENVDSCCLFVPSDGRTGGTTRVSKSFPMISEWKGKITFHILDDIITEDVFETHLKEAGNFIGIGFFRPERGGYWGRFKVNKIDWNE